MKKTTITIEGIPFTYDDEIDDITYETISPITNDDALKLLKKTKSLFDQKGLRFSLIFGTLLGAVRDKSVIQGDEDVDIFVESEIKLQNILPFLQQNGLHLCRVYEHMLYSFRIPESKAYIDVYIQSNISGIWGHRYCRINHYILPKYLIQSLSPIPFLGEDFWAPRKPERFLEFWYGKTWKTPIEGDHTKHGSTIYDAWKENKSISKPKRLLHITRLIFHHIISGRKIY